jgi:hypothetical protein
MKPTRVQRLEEVAAGAAALAGALWLNHQAGLMADAAGAHAGLSPDLLLTYLPIVDTGPLFVWGFLVFLLAIIAVGATTERRRAAYILWSYALLTATRAFFIVLTPMHRPAGGFTVDGDPLFRIFGPYMTFHHDLFFSSHTASPFMAYLLVRGKWIRRFFLALSVLLALTVLLGRFHYSIDVFAAYFIAFAVHKAEVRWFQPSYNAWKREYLNR